VGSVICWILRCVFTGNFGTLGRGVCGEMIGVVRFDGLCMFVVLVLLGFDNVYGFIKGGGVACVSKYLHSAFLPPDSLRMIAAVCGVGGNWMVQI